MHCRLLRLKMCFLSVEKIICTVKDSFLWTFKKHVFYQPQVFLGYTLTKSHAWLSYTQKNLLSVFLCFMVIVKQVRHYPKISFFLKEQWTLNNISMFIQLPNDISSSAQQFFFPTKHGLNQALLSLSVSRAFLPELHWGYYIQAQELILQLLKLHPLIPVCCSRRLQGQTTMERFLYTDSLPQHLCPPIGSQVATTKGAIDLTTTALWTGSLSDVHYLFGFSRPVRHPSLPSDPTHKLTRWQLTALFLL